MKSLATEGAGLGSWGDGTETRVMNDRQIVDGINKFERWHYEFDLAGHKTPIFRADHINRHAQRREYFFRSMVSLLGGTLAGKRVLDLACNAGFWSLCAVESGCDFVLGVDGRQMHVDQANFVFEAKGIDPKRYRFEHRNVFDLFDENLGKFDIVLCLGLMYHISKPVTLLERIAAINTDLLVVDTELSGMEGSLFEVRYEKSEDPRSTVDFEQVLVPTRSGLVDVIRAFGYRTVVLKPRFSDYTGAPDYEDGLRRAFICAKQTPLDSLEADRDPAQEKASGKLPGLDDLMAVPATTLVQTLVAKAKRRLRNG